MGVVTGGDELNKEVLPGHREERRDQIKFALAARQGVRSPDMLPVVFADGPQRTSSSTV